MFLVSSTFWFHVGLMFGGIVLAASGVRVLEIPVALIAGVAFFISGVLGVIADLGGPRAPVQQPS